MWNKLDGEAKLLIAVGLPVLAILAFVFLCTGGMHP